MSAKIDRTGEHATASNGQDMEIIAYRNRKDIDVRFEDGTIVCNRTYNKFLEGCIENPNKKCSRIQNKYEIGYTKTAFNGMKMTVIEEISALKLKIRFEDGTERIVRRDSFTRGYVKNPNLPAWRKSYVGIEGTASTGQKMVIIDDSKGASALTVQFDDGTIKENVTYGNFTQGYVSNPVRPGKFKAWSREGLEKRIKNGLNAKVVKYNRSDNVIVEFEDGVQVTTSWNQFKLSSIHHPNLDRRHRKVFHGFDTLYAFDEGTEDGYVYYHCLCKECGLKDILTPQQMIKHEKEHLLKKKEEKQI